MPSTEARGVAALTDVAFWPVATRKQCSPDSRPVGMGWFTTKPDAGQVRMLPCGCSQTQSWPRKNGHLPNALQRMCSTVLQPMYAFETPAWSAAGVSKPGQTLRSPLVEVLVCSRRFACIPASVKCSHAFCAAATLSQGCQHAANVCDASTMAGSEHLHEILGHAQAKIWKRIWTAVPLRASGSLQIGQQTTLSPRGCLQIAWTGPPQRCRNEV